MVVLLERGAKTDATRTDGATPLWIAAQMGHDHIVRRLLKAGAKVDATRHVRQVSFTIAKNKFFLLYCVIVKMVNVNFCCRMAQRHFSKQPIKVIPLL